MRAENSLIWAEYDDEDFIMVSSFFTAYGPGERVEPPYDVACQVLSRNVSGGMNVVAWSDGKGNSFELELIKDLIDMTGQKRNQLEMAGDCLGAVFRFWSRADSNQRDMLANQMIVDLKLPASLFYAMDEAIPPPSEKEPVNNACTDFYRGFTNRLYAQGKRREGKRPLLDSYPQGPHEARRQIYMRAAYYIRAHLAVHHGKFIYEDEVQYKERLNRTVNPVLTQAADELESIFISTSQSVLFDDGSAG